MLLVQIENTPEGYLDPVIIQQFIIILSWFSRGKQDTLNKFMFQSIAARNSFHLHQVAKAW